MNYKIIEEMKTAAQIKREYYSKQILKWLLIGGVITLASILSPTLPFQLAKRALGEKNITRRKSTNVFYYLKKKGFIEVRREGRDVHIALTPDGKRRAGKYQIDELCILRPKQWDKKWRVVLFDIPNVSNIIRNVFRAKLKELGFAQLQKSAWVHPFPCRDAIELVREFLGATPKEIIFLEVDKLEDDTNLRKIFRVS
ncbi:MAG: hypothetical protein HYS52_00620 [Candidatus Wildermuthbacteria bacterium]|nr:hypothetical protein [Candidatus Wildermuthbacteria bacterium]